MSAQIIWMIGAAVLSVPTAVVAKGQTSELVESADLNLMAAAGRERLDERLKASVSAACKHHSAYPVAQFQPGPGGKGIFMVARENPHGRFVSTTWNVAPTASVTS